MCRLSTWLVAAVLIAIIPVSILERHTLITILVRRIAILIGSRGIVGRSAVQARSFERDCIAVSWLNRRSNSAEHATERHIPFLIEIGRCGEIEALSEGVTLIVAELEGFH